MFCIVLKKLRNTERVDDELKELKVFYQPATPPVYAVLVGVAIQAEVSELRSRPKLGLLDLIREPWMRYPLLISIGLHLSQQLSGINGVRCDVVMSAILFCMGIKIRQHGIIMMVPITDTQVLPVNWNNKTLC